MLDKNSRTPFLPLGPSVYATNGINWFRGDSLITILKWRLRIDNSTFRKIERDSTEEKPRNHTVTYSYILYRTCMWKIMVLQRFYGCLFCSSKKSLFEKMGDVGRFVIGKCVTAKAIYVLHLSECARRYGSDKKTKQTN